jgi:Tol biopolymer transport system component
VGEQLQLTATVTDATGRVVEIPQLHALFWESSVPDVASVISVMQGMSTTVTGIGAGTAVITARVTNGGQIGTGSARVTVDPATTPTGAIASTLCSQFDGPCGVYALDPDGSNGRFLTSNPWDLDPVWSPDGTSIAFRSERACGGGRFCLTDLYVLKFDGSGVRSLTTSLGLEVGGMSWSPDGSRIVFAAGALTADLRFDEALYVMNADGSGLRVLLSGPPGASASWPDWSPDGSRIAYTAVRGDTSAISVVNADGSNEVRISTPPAPNRDVRPRWSPDGKRIAFTRWWFSSSDNTPGALSQTLVMNADGSNVTQLINDSLWPWYPAWSPDGTSLVVFSRFYDGLFVVNADGTGGRPIPTLCCGFDMSSAPSWRRAPAAVPTSVESSAQ